MEKLQTPLINQQPDCQKCREYLPNFLDQTLPLEGRQAVGSHLRECEECFSIYADLVDERADEDDKSLYVADRSLWGPLTWGLEEDEEYLQELLFLAHEREKGGGVVLVKHHPIQEKSFLLLFCLLSVQLKREGKQVIFVSPSMTDTLLPLLEETRGTPLYLLAPEGTQAAAFNLFLQTLARHNQNSEAAKVVAVMGAGPEYGKEEELEGPIAPEVYTIPCPEADGELARFDRRLGEEVAAIREELAKADQTTNRAYTTVALLDAWGIPMPLVLLARLLELTPPEATQVVDQAKGLLFWVDFPEEGAKEQISAAAPAIARQFLPSQEELLDAYVSLVGAASQEERGVIVRLLRRLSQQGRITLARALTRRCRETLTALWQGASAQEHVLYGKALLTLGELAEAERIYRQGYGRDPENSYLLHALAVVVGKTAQYGDKAVDVYLEQLARQPGQQENPYLWQAWAEQARRRGLFPKAEGYFRKALTLDPHNLPALLGYANLELKERGKGRQGEPYRQHAAKLLLRAREIDYRNVYALHSLGMLEKERAKYAVQTLPHLQEATHYFRTALRIDPYNLPALNALATLEKERGHLSQTEEHLRRALEIDSENLHCLTAWGELWTSVYKDCGRQDAAEEAEWAFKQALAIDEENPHAAVGYARLLSLLERFQEADAYLKQAIKLPGKTAETLAYVSTVRGESAALQGDYQRAVREFEDARSKGALAAYTALAKVLAQENLPRAHRLLKEAHDLEPNNVIVYNTEAGIEEQYGDKVKAREAFEKSLAIDPENAYTHWRYAELLEGMGEQEEADAHLRRAEDLGFALSELSLWSKGSLQGNQTTEETTPLDADSLYTRYGKPLEREHHGKYIAISQDGRVIVDTDDLSVVGQAINVFGSGNFVFCRIGYSYVWKLRWGHAGQHGLSISSGKGHCA